jgi:broad specificity phosphatase PhoE
MSLLLVRHGQASAGSDDYDRLSARGHEQSLRLGRWLAASGHRFDRVVVGGMRRHRETFDAVREGYASALPEPDIDPGLAEFDHHAVFDGFRQRWPEHPAVAAAHAGGLPALGALIHAALEAWSRDGLEAVPETWSAFGARVRAAGDRLAQRRERVLAITSGGVVSRLAQCALGADDRAAIGLNMSLRNSGLCEFLPRPWVEPAATGWDGVGLASWNTVPHLHDARELWTYY